MKITGTKKLLIILTSLVFTAAAGLGMLFGGLFYKAPKVYAQTTMRALSGDEDKILQEFSEISGIDAKLLKFYAESNNFTVEMLYQNYLYDEIATGTAISEFLSLYSQGQIVNENIADMADEDWFVAPDEVSSYAYWIAIGDSWTAYHTSKAFITQESQYWRLPGFQWGHMYLGRNVGVGNTTYDTSAAYSYYNYDTAYTIYWDSCWVYDIAWLEEGEEFTFGITSNRGYAGIYASAMSTDFFIEKYLTDKPRAVYDSALGGNNTGWYPGIFTDEDYTTPNADTDPCTIGFDYYLNNGNKVYTKTKADWLEEFRSDIVPYTSGSNGSLNNTKYASWTADSAAHNGTYYNAGDYKIKISKDAPSGMYYMSFYYPYYGGVGSVFGGVHLGGTMIEQVSPSGAYNSISGWTGWTYFMNYGVLLCRRDVSAPQAEYGEGVSPDLTSKTISYNGEPQTFTLKGDWGPGMFDVTTEVWNDITSSWVPTTNLNAKWYDPSTDPSIDSNLLERTAINVGGLGIAGNTVFTATTVGKYRILYTPFRNWDDGTMTPKEYFFEVKPMLLKKTTLVQEEGVTQATNTKFVYATGNTLYVSLYPVSQQWAEASYPGLSLEVYSTSGVMTLSGVAQNPDPGYKITISLVDDVNTAWDDGTDYGSIDDLIFTFIIGPEKIVVPDIIQDTGQIGAFKKEVTFNGAYQTMSFLPIRTYQLNILVENVDTDEILSETSAADRVGYIVSDNTLVVRAFDAGTYRITLTVKPEYIFEEMSTSLVYELIIYEAEIDAPELDEPGVTGTVKIVTYGGERIIVDDEGKTQTWYATLSFKNANESLIYFRATDGLNQLDWGNSELILSARPAGTYYVNFYPNKNYKWKPGVTPPQYTLIIERLKIAKPVLVNDHEDGAEFTPANNPIIKSIGFDGNDHPFTISLPTLEGTNTQYTKKSSVLIVHTGSFDDIWAADGSSVSFNVSEAATYTFTISPTPNYCWPDGSTSNVILTFEIIPVTIDALQMWVGTAQDYDDEELEQIEYADNGDGFIYRFFYDGGEKVIRIGDAGAQTPQRQYVTDDEKFSKYFFLINDDESFVGGNEEGASKLLPGMHVTEDDGYLTIWAVEAGTYRIGVFIKNTNYRWAENNQTMIVYTLVIEAKSLPQPLIDEDASAGHAAQFERQIGAGTYAMNDIYALMNFEFVITLDKAEYFDYISITDMGGVVYEHVDMTDIEVRDEVNEALSEGGVGYYVYWNPTYKTISFFARDYGVYTWTIKITNGNYKWANTNAQFLTYTLNVKRSPVSGLNMYYVGDSTEKEEYGVDGKLVGYEGAWGADSEARQELLVFKTTFSDEEKEFYFERTNTANLVNTGFDEQYTYDVRMIAVVEGSKMRALEDGGLFVFNEDELRLSALDAGTYEISISPTNNYCWNDSSGSNVSAVTFKLIIDRLKLDRPVILNDDGTELDPSVGEKTTQFNHEYQTFALSIKKFPQGYAIKEVDGEKCFIYYDTENRVGVDFAEVKVDGEYTENGFTKNLGVDIDAKTVAVQAKSAGDYGLIMTVSNPNNYYFEDGELEYTLHITKLQIELPKAYLSTQALTAEEADKRDVTYDRVDGSASLDAIGQKTQFDDKNFYQVNTTYNGTYYTVYFYGGDVSKGDFYFTVTSKDNNPNGMDLKREIHPDDELDDGLGKAGYFRLAATSVNEYIISLTFTTRDFYWSDSNIDDSESGDRTFTFIINRNVIDVPEITGFENQPLLVNENGEYYKADFDYELDPSTGEPVSRTIELANVFLGAEVDTDGVFVYSNITVMAGANATVGGVHIEITPDLLDSTYGTISFSTAEGGEISGALVTYVYYIELSINPLNSEWRTGDKSANKLYYIIINAMKVTDPRLSNSDVQGAQRDRHLTYTGDVFNDALIITGFDADFMEYTPSLNLTPEGASGPDITVSGSQINVKALAPVDVYTITVSLVDPDNTTWKDGSIDAIVFSFIVDKIKVAKPYIENSKKETSVVGLTKTVTYIPGTAQFIEIVNYWFDPAVLDPSGTPPVTDDGSVTLTAPIPDVMSFSIANADPDSIVYSYNKVSGAYQSMKYNDFNNGYLKVEATGAGRYTIRFTLSDNAMWIDESLDPIDVTLVIKKIEIDDLVIMGGDSEASISNDGFIKTIMYKLDGSGNAIDRELKLKGFDDSLMTLDETPGVFPANVTGYSKISVDGGTDNGYEFTAKKAGEYVFKFVLNDGDNYRWKYANTDEISFTLKIAPLELQIPVIYTGYKLINESIDSASRSLTVDYDLHEHTIIIQSLFERLKNGDYSGLGEDYYFVVKNTSYDDGTLDEPTHKSELNAYDDTSDSGRLVKDLFDILGLGTYDFSNANDPAASILNAFTLTAYTPGTYTLTFSLVDDENMVWFDNGVRSTDDIVFTLIIDKVKHDAPEYMPGENNSKQYAGGDVNFSLINLYNGVNEPNSTTVTSTVSEKYKVDYDGEDTTVMTDYAADNKCFEESWYNGKLTLKFRAVGTYKVTVEIADPDNIEWNGLPGTTEKEFYFTVAKRELTTSITFSAVNDADVNTELQKGSTEWYISTEVKATIVIRGLREIPSGAVDRDLKFKIYYEITTDLGTEIETLDLTGSNILLMQAGPFADGTYSLTYVYDQIHHGLGNVVKGVYILHIEQDEDYVNSASMHSNYVIPDPELTFTIDADPAPFKTDMLEWYYERSDMPGIPIPVTGIGGDSDNRLTLTYKEGVTFTFYLKLNTKGMDGYEGGPYTDIVDALNSWKVDWDGVTYGGDRIVSAAGDHDVYVTITALDPNEFSYNEPPFTLYYTIQPAKYDLSNLSWDYNADEPFEFDGTVKKVAIDGLGTAYPGLSVLYFETQGTFESGGSTYDVLPSTANDGGMIYAGVYTTTVYFQIPANSNYVLPEQAEAGSYTGTFSWSITWEIKPQEIEVDWIETTTTSSNGETTTRNSPAIDAPHSNKFWYTYQKWDDVDGWVDVNAITRVPGVEVKYRATAHLWSTPTVASTDYSRNYTFVVRGDNPLEFEVGGDDVVIINHIEINGMTDSEYEYTGEPFVAESVVDLDTTNGLINDETKMWVDVVYYNTATPDVTFTAAPVEPGTYVAVMKLNYVDATDDYVLLMPEFEFTIIKAKIKYSEFEWRFDHDDGNGLFTAKLDDSGNWINVDTNEIVEMDYDGRAYKIYLWSDKYNDSQIYFTYYDTNIEIDADEYTATIEATLDEDHYQIDSSDEIPEEYDWEIKKHKLDLSEIDWDYEGAYEFTLVNNTPKSFSPKLKNVPSYLIDKMIYKIERNAGSGYETVTNTPTDSGKYRTTVSIDEDAIDFDNYELDMDSWPTAVSDVLNWQIKRKELSVPSDDRSWKEFDGLYNNLLDPFKFDSDWEEYFSVEVEYAEIGSDSFSEYDGSKYGGKYIAYNAGTYRFTFKVNPDHNTDSIKNIVWIVNESSVYTATTDDQVVSYTVEKKTLTVSGWTPNYELSTVIIDGGIDPTKFVDYEFYRGDGLSGEKVGLEVVLSSAGDERFSMTGIVKAAYAGNIILKYNPGQEYTSFLTKKITADNATLVNQEKPTLLGYKIGTTTKPFTTADYDDDNIPFVIYTGQPITFVIRNWDYYKNILTFWNGSEEDLTRTDVGEYSVTLILRTDLDKPLYWGINDDNSLDRAPVTLKFAIKYRELTIPEIPEEITYTGSEIDILSKVTNTTLAKLMAEYGEYVTIDGRVATNVGSTMLRLIIKPEYGTSVRWSDGTVDPKAMLWTILPILLAQPVKDESVTVVYDGNEHSLFEFLVGYSENPSEYFKNLMLLAKDEKAYAINAGTYPGSLSLPDSNYAWCDESGNIVNLGNKVEISWTIDKQEIDFSEAYWGYLDSNNDPQAYDEENPFVYTVKNGAPVEFTVQLFGMPEILKLFASYNTDGTAGNSASAVGDYVTYVEYDLNNFDWNNYIISSEDLTYSSQLNWKIVAREFETPTVDNEDNRIKEVYDGTVRDIIKMLGLGADWAEYFDIKVEYKEIEGGTYSDYAGNNMSIVGYSNYSIYYVGFYRITITLKAQEPVWSPGNNILWKDGEPAQIVIEIAEREIVVTSWNEDNQYSTAEFEGGALPEAIAEKLEYIVYEEGDLNKTPVAPEDIEGGKTYYIELRIKSGSNADGIPYAYGIILNTDAVSNPLEFGRYDYGNQPLFWMPMPVLKTAVMEYNGKEQEFVIIDFDTLYKLSDEERAQLNYNYPNLKLDVSIKSFVYLQDANSLKATAAGEYSAVVRLQNKIYLSWFDPNLYYVSADHTTLFHKGTTTPVSDAESLYNSKSIVLNFKITPKKIPLLSDEDLEMLIDLIVQYNGTEKDVTVDGFNKELDMTAAEIFAKLEAKYGSVFNFDGTKGTIAGIYEMLISIADIDSCSWYDPDEMELKDKKVKEIGGYRLEYVLEGEFWSLKLVKVDANGKPVKDSAGNYVEYFDEEGDYTIDAKYQPIFKTDYVAIDDLLNADGSLNTDNPANKFFHDGNEICTYPYVTDENGNPVQYYKDGDNYLPADDEHPGEFLLRYELEYNDDYKDYGYMIPEMEDDTYYYYLFSRLSNGANGKIPDKDAFGNYIDVYLAWNNSTSSYELRKYTVVDGEFVLNGSDPEYTVIMSAANGDFSIEGSDYYSMKDGTVIFEVNASGKYMKICMLDGGSRKQRIAYETDEFGHYVIVQDDSVIWVEAHEKATGARFVVGKNEAGGLEVTREDDADGISYVIEWTLDSSSLPTPKFDEANKPEYTGKKIYAKDYLIDFDPLTMEIVEDSYGIEAGEYYAKIRITNENSKWADTDEEFVIVSWSIAKAKVDLGEVKWVYRDANGTYDDDSSFIYTRKDGDPVIYWVELANLPTALKGKVIYTTNSVMGANAGTDAGKYETSFAFNTDETNFESVEIPDSLAYKITWNIQRRLIEVPQAHAVEFFDKSEHDLLKMLGVSEDWNEYYDIEVMYSNGITGFVPYAGHDGNPYMAYEAGSYKFTFSIKEGINTSLTNPNVAWLKKSTAQPPEVEEEPDEIEEIEPATISALEAPAEDVFEVEEPAFVEIEEIEEVASVAEVMPVAEIQAVQEQSVEAQPTKSLIEKICDELKNLVCGAQVQTQSYRKYGFRGTL